MASTPQIVKIEFIQRVQSSLLRFCQSSAERFAGIARIDAPHFAQVFRDIIFLFGGEIGEGAPQKDERALEFRLVKRIDICAELLPKAQTGDQGITVLHGKPLEPARAQLRGDARRKAAAHLGGKQLVRDLPALQKDRRRKAGKLCIQVVAVGQIGQDSEPARLVDTVGMVERNGVERANRIGKQAGRAIVAGAASR